MTEEKGEKSVSLLNAGNNNEKSQSAKSAKDKNKASFDCRPWGMCAFVANISILFLFSFTQGVYTIGVIRTIEKRFGLSSAKSGFMMSIGDIAHIIIITFVGYFGQKTHKPRFISVNIIFSIAAGVLMTLPYFLYSKDPLPYAIPTNDSSLLFQSTEVNDEFCRYSNESNEGCMQEKEVNENANAYYIFLVAQVLQGIGGAGVSTLSLAYVDENVNKESSSLYIGIITSVFGIGPILGLLLGAVCTGLPENLQSSDVPHTHPNFIGAWWLGYLLCAIATALASIPLYCFPSHQRDRDAPQQAKQEKFDFVKMIKDYPASLFSLLTNKAYVCLLACYVLSMYIIMGVFINIPRYLEIHFLQPAFIANIVAALPGVAGVVGGLLGGIIMAKTRLKPPGAALFIIFSLVTSVVGLGIIAFLECPQVEMNGLTDDNGILYVETPCNMNCSCLTDQKHYRPVCGSDNMTYFSACHAGCDVMDGENYGDCKCVGGVETASQGLCLESCDMIYPFAIVLLTTCLVSSISRVPGTVIQFRVVNDDEKAFAISVTSFTVNLLGPILFGAMIDSACILWQRTCDTVGNCLLFNTTIFRHLTYSVSAALQLGGLVFAVLLYLIIKDRDYTDKEEITVEVEKGDFKDQENMPLKINA